MADDDNIHFIPNDPAGNAAKLVEFFGLSSAFEVPVKRFILDGDDIYQETEVREKEYELALLLLYFCTLSIKGIGRQKFYFNDAMRQMVLDYFGPTLCEDAVRNPETKHTTIRALLTGKNVTLQVETEPHH